jgi:hypothetical protein
VGTDEEQREPPVLDRIGIELLHDRQRPGRTEVVEWLGQPVRRRTAEVVPAIARHGEEPRLGTVRDPGLWPGAQRLCEGLGEAVLGRLDVAVLGGHDSEEPAVGGAGQLLGARRGVLGHTRTGSDALVHAPSANRTAEGRISTVPQ